MFAQIRNFVPTPRQPHPPRGYVGRHRVPEPVVETPAPPPAPADEVEPEPVQV